MKEKFRLNTIKSVRFIASICILVSVLCNAADPPFSAFDNAENAIVPSGFAVDVIASEPAIGQPISFAWDHLGRLWVAECNSYADRSLNYDLTQSDRILVLSDEDQDGTFEKMDVFADHLQRLTSVAIGFGGVWALTSPNMIFIPDSDGDLVPDGPAVVKLDGFDLKSTRHTIGNGLKWGPDGWLYGRHGIQSTSTLGKPGTIPAKRVRVNTGIWRYQPQKESVELWTEGGTNPWGHDWNSQGDLFYINTVIGHFWHGIPGAYTKRMYGQHERDYLYQLLDMHADHWHFDINGNWRATRENANAEDAYGGGHAHTGLMIYQAEKWPQEFRGDVFTLNFHGRRINRESIRREGSGWIASHKPDFLKFPDPWFRGIDLMQGPDGDVYVLDWSDVGECHDNDSIHRGSGRIYRIRYGDFGSVNQVAPQTFTELDDFLRHSNVWYARQALLLIQELNAANLLSRQWISELTKRFATENNEELSLRYFYALHAAGVLRAEMLLQDSRESIRVQALYLLREKEGASARKLTGLLKAARNDSVRVRLAIASLLPRLDSDSQVLVAEQLVRHAKDSEDHNFPLMVWYGIEPLIAAADETVLRRVLGSCRIDELSRFIFRRLAEDYDANRSLISRLMQSFPKHISAGLAGMADALEGAVKATPPPKWDVIVKKANGTKYVNQLGALFGNGASLNMLLEIAENQNADPDARRRAVKSLAGSDLPDLKTHLMRWIDDSQLSGVCAEALARYSDLSVGKKLLDRWGYMKPVEQAATIDILVTRSSWTELLLDKMESNRFTPEILTPVHVRQISQLGQQKLIDRLTTLWGEVNTIASDEETEKLELKIRRLTTPDSLQEGDPIAGRSLFSQRCAGCHRLYGEGGYLGPDLTGSSRAEIDYLLENLLYPSAIVPSGYRMSSVKLKDGRTLIGTLSAQTDQRISLNLPGMRQPAIISNDEVISIESSNQSMMPAGLIDDLKEDQIRNLFAYLMGDHQVPIEH